MSTSQDSNEAELSGHEYDGIQEYDNPLPGWWLATFYGAIIFSIGYFGYYMMGPGPSLVDEFHIAHTKSEIARVAAMSNRKLPTDEELLVVYNNPVARKQGNELYQAKCASCHGPQGQGGIGPNLTDDYWLYGSKLSQIAKTVTFGIPEKGMPPWGGMLSPEEVNTVTAHVKSLRGTHPPNAKLAQGTLVSE